MSTRLKIENDSFGGFTGLCTAFPSDECAISSAIGKIGLITRKKSPFFLPPGGFGQPLVCVQELRWVLPLEEQERRSACTSRWFSRVVGVLREGRDKKTAHQAREKKASGASRIPKVCKSTHDNHELENKYKKLTARHHGPQT